MLVTNDDTWDREFSIGNLIVRLTFPDIMREARGSVAGRDVVEDDFVHNVVGLYCDGGGAGN